MIRQIACAFLGVVPAFFILGDEAQDNLSEKPRTFDERVVGRESKTYSWKTYRGANSAATFDHWSKQFMILGELGYFRPTKSLFREIYGSSLLNYRLSMQIQLYETLFAMVDTNFLYKQGRALGEGETTDLTLVPVDLGLKWYVPVTHSVSFYVKAGAEITGTFITNNTPYVEDIKQSSAGAITGVGLFSSLSKRYSLCINLFADYSFVQLNPFGKVGAEGEKVEIGGLILGGGLGYRF